MRSLAAAVLFLISGCDLYFGGGGDDAPCAYGAAGAKPEADYQLRNPYTGQCESQGGGWGCDDRCGPCPLPAADIAIAPQDWATCFSPCEQLDESSCLATSGCRAAYLDNGHDGTPGADFFGCWATAPSGPVQGGGCTGLDAQECSRHDDCSPHHLAQYLPTDGIESTTFASCAPEPSVPNSCSNVTCQPGSHCEQQCTMCDGPGCELECQAMCVPDTNGCLAADCAPGTECVETCTAPAPGMMNGTCQIECVPVGACATLPSEAACAERADCTPVYEGEDCTCYPGYCECNILTYNRCE